MCSVVEARVLDVAERCEQTLGTSSTYQNKRKNVLVNICAETFNL
jgi:hypothetical protein